MKSSLMRPALALALVLGLSACGGKATFPVGVTVIGLQYPGLVLSTNGMDLAVAPGTAAATITTRFPNELQYGEVYNVLPTKQPDHQSCVAYNGTNTDTAGRLAQINATFTCSLNKFTIGGTITGLKADGLVLTNGSTGGTFGPVAIDTTTNAYPTSFTFAAPVVFGTTYGVTVLTQPTGQTCSVSPNGAGTMGDAAVTDIAIACVTNPT